MSMLRDCNVGRSDIVEQLEFGKLSSSKKNYCHIEHSGDGISTLVDGVWQPALGTGNEALMSGNMRSKRQRNLNDEQYTFGIATKL